MLVRGSGAVLLLALGLASSWGCSHSQTAPTPAPNGSTTTVSSSSSASSSSKTEKPWKNAAKTPAAPTVADLTAPMDVAMVLCSSALNLAPCAVITSGASDIMTCFAGCQTQIESVVAMAIEHAAEKCASSPPPEAGPRECILTFPPTAALDTEMAGKTCNALCDELAAKVAGP